MPVTIYLAASHKLAAPWALRLRLALCRPTPAPTAGGGVPAVPAMPPWLTADA